MKSLLESSFQRFANALFPISLNELKIEEKGNSTENQAKNTDYCCVNLESATIVCIDCRLAQLENHSSYCLDTSEYAEWVLRGFEFEAKQLLCMCVHGSVHEPPTECEKVYQSSFCVLRDHEEAEKPDEHHIDDVKNDTSPAAHSVHNLSHYQ